MTSREAWADLSALCMRLRRAVTQADIARELAWTPGTTARRVQTWKRTGLLRQERAGVWPTQLPADDLPLPQQLPLPLRSLK